MITGWLKIDGKWYYHKDGEKITKAGWIQDTDGRWYYLSGDGAMQTGWISDVDGRYYYCQTETKTIDGTKYYAGEMRKGWFKDIDGRWYYLQSSKKVEDGVQYYTGEMRTGWLLLDNKWYYLVESSDSHKGIYKGQCIINTIITINGKSRSFDKDGVWQPVTLEQLKQLGWINAENVIDDLNFCLNKFSITDYKYIQHFISQCAHESGCGKWTQEIADGSAYEGRKDLGNTHSGDGKKYKGAGFIQLTGRSNYQDLANYLGDQKIMNGVSYVSSKYPWTSAGRWWDKNKLNKLIDNGATCLNVSAKVNTGNASKASKYVKGLQDRQNYYAKCCKIFV